MQRLLLRLWKITHLFFLNVLWKRAISKLEITQICIKKRRYKENMIYIDTHKRYYSTIKINELLLQSTTWMNLKITILSERSQAILNTYYICMWFQLYKTFIKYDFICIKFYTANYLVTEWRSVVAWGQMDWERGEKLQPWVNFKE